MSPSDSLGISTGPTEIWIMGCLCGYNEFTEPNRTEYIRGYKEGKQLIEEQSK